MACQMLTNLSQEASWGDPDYPNFSNFGSPNADKLPGDLLRGSGLSRCPNDWLSFLAAVAVSVNASARAGAATVAEAASAAASAGRVL